MKQKRANRKGVLTALFAVFLWTMLPVYALSPVEAFLSMPDDLCPYFNRVQKNVLCAQLAGARGENMSDSIYPVPNLFGSESLPLELTDSVLRIQVTDGVEYDWLIAPDGIVFVQTICAPVCSSVVGFYDFDWRWLRAIEPDIDALFVRTHIENGALVYTDETPLLLDEEEKKHYNSPTTD